jgi:LysM repeat protein
VYVVQPGDTLFALSRRTGVPVAEIARVNNIPPDSQLRVGQQLRIPAAPAAVPPGAAATAAPSSAGPPIRVTSPESGASVRSPIGVQGVANVFEGVVNIEVLSGDGTALTRASATASQPDAGQPGPFRTEVTLPAGTSGPVTLRVFWRSPRDGSPVDEVRVPLTVVG